LLRILHKEKKLQTDDELLRKYIETGNQDLLAEIYFRYYHLVYGICLKYFNDREMAKDGVMMIYEKLLAELQRHEVRNFKSWLYKLTVNFCLMQIRSQKARRKNFMVWKNGQDIFVETEDEVHPIDKDNPDETRLKDCLKQLKEEQKQCITLFYYDNKSYREISELLELEEKKVKSYLQNAKRNLKKCLENKNVQSS